MYQIQTLNKIATAGLNVLGADYNVADTVENPREEYQEAEERVIDELREINKPFIVLLNCMYPNSQGARQLSEELGAKYCVPRSGAASSAAAEGVGARRSAAKSHRVKSVSWPTAEITAAQASF